MTPTDLEAVRKRHEDRTKRCGPEWGEDCVAEGVEAHDDVAALLAHIDTPLGHRMVEDVARIIARDMNQHQLDTGFAFDIDFPEAKGGLERDWEEYIPTATALLQRFPGLGSWWKDSKSAPTDGNEFIGWDRVHRFAVYDLFHDGDRFISRGTRWSGHFSHWMPSLPSPPAGEK